jgi:hypothetical protein
MRLLSITGRVGPIRWRPAFGQECSRERERNIGATAPPPSSSRVGGRGATS